MLPEFVADPQVQPGDALLVGHVRLERELADVVLEQVDADDAGAFPLEHGRGRGTDATGRARDDTDLPLEPHDAQDALGSGATPISLPSPPRSTVRIGPLNVLCADV